MNLEDFFYIIVGKSIEEVFLLTDVRTRIIESSSSNHIISNSVDKIPETFNGVDED